MSSTNRGGASRAGDDAYSTPGWSTRLILSKLGPLGGRRILEPSAGRGAIVRELLRAGADSALLTAVERNAETVAVLRRLAADTARPFTVEHADFLNVGYAGRERFGLAVMNPPFSAAEPHVEWALEGVRDGGAVAALLRLAFCCGAKRAPFRARVPFDLFPLASRPSFTAEVLAWATDQDLAGMAVDVADASAPEGTRPETVAEVRKRLRGSDSADYAWFVFYRDRAGSRHRGGRFEVLEGGKS